MPQIALPFATSTSNLFSGLGSLGPTNSFIPSSPLLTISSNASSNSLHNKFPFPPQNPLDSLR